MSNYEYLYTEYGYSKEASSYCKYVDDIKGYFEEDWSSYLDQGQGWHDSEATVFIFVEGKSFKVELEVDEISTMWMDRGEKMHQIESIHEPVITEIETPSPKKRFNCSFEGVSLTQLDINEIVAKGLTLTTQEVSDNVK